MTAREVVMLGTASMSPTRHRNHNGYALRWDDKLVFFDPGEGFQRQCTIAGIAIARADAVCLTHFHGDHCLGLPGLIARRAADHIDEPLDVYFPGDGEEYFEKLRSCTASAFQPPTRSHPVHTSGVIGSVGDLVLTALPLRHRITTYGYRLQEPDGRTFDADELAARGIVGPDVGKLHRDGEIDTPTGRVTLDEVSTPRIGQSMALVMDTAVCDSILDLARDVDLLVIESTFLDADIDLAEKYRHLTAGQAGRLATEAGARRVVLTHFSQRYGSGDPAADDGGVGRFVEEASAHHHDVHGAHDFDVIAVPART